CSIHKNDLGDMKTFSVWAQNSNDYNYFHFITYERDKYASMKSVQEPGNDAVVFYMEAKYDNEFYYVTSNQYILPYGWPNVGYIRNYPSTKGSHNVSRL
ncbi:MAG: hypothetical protein ABIP51_13210, partial [Bacteroidia bacterium]